MELFTHSERAWVLSFVHMALLWLGDFLRPWRGLDSAPTNVRLSFRRSLSGFSAFVDLSSAAAVLHGDVRPKGDRQTVGPLR